MSTSRSRYGVFISYSRTDLKFVTPIVNIIKASRKDLVFQDYLSIPPGKLWRTELEQALNQSQIVYVFWCQHAAQSEEVRKEYSQAIKSKKDVVPVLLDNTSLNDELAPYQGVDLRGSVSHKKNASRKFSAKVVLLPQAVIMAFLIITGIFYNPSSQNPGTMYQQDDISVHSKDNNAREMHEQIASAEREVENARLQVETAQRKVDRYRRTVARDDATEKKLSAANNDLQKAKSNHASATEKLTQLRQQQTNVRSPTNSPDHPNRNSQADRPERQQDHASGSSNSFSNVVQWFIYIAVAVLLVSLLIAWRQNVHRRKRRSQEELLASEALLQSLQEKVPAHLP